MPHVMAILKLSQILRKVATADMNMRAIDPALEARPVAFDPVDARAVVRGELAAVMLHRLVVVPKHIEAAVRTKFVGRNGRTGKDMLLNQRFHRRAMTARYNLRHHVAAALEEADNGVLVALVSRALPLDRTADQRFVDLDCDARAAERSNAVNHAHVLADHVAHAPSGFVGDAQLALDTLGSDAVPRRGEKEHDVEPVAQRRAGAVAGRSRGRIDLIAAMLASVGAPRLDAVVGRLPLTTLTVVARAVASAHQVIQATFLGRKAVLKLAERGGFGAHTDGMSQPLTCRKGIIAERLYRPVDRAALARIICEGAGDDFDAFGIHWENTHYADTADAIIDLLITGGQVPVTEMEPSNDIGG